LRPNRSPRTPKVNSRPAKTSVYELMAHSSSPWVAPSPCSGSASTRRATLRIVLSRTTTSRPNTSTPRISHRRGWPVSAGVADTSVSPLDPATLRRGYDTEPSRIRRKPRASTEIRDGVVSYCAADHRSRSGSPAARMWQRDSTITEAPSCG
jgi:hypothetical protein